MKWVIIALVVVTSSQKAFSIECYRGTGRAESIKETVECEGSCLKLFSKSDNSGEAVYGCVNLKLEDGCQKDDDKKGLDFVECLCTSNLCNGSASKCLALPLLILALIFARLTW